MNNISRELVQQQRRLSGKQIVQECSLVMSAANEVPSDNWVPGEIELYRSKPAVSIGPDSEVVVYNYWCNIGDCDIHVAVLGGLRI